MYQFYFHHIYKSEMGLGVRKPVFGVCDYKSADQPAYLRSLVSAFVAHLLETLMTKKQKKDPLTEFSGSAHVVYSKCHTLNVHMQLSGLYV